MSLLVTCFLQLIAFISLLGRKGERNVLLLEETCVWLNQLLLNSSILYSQFHTKICSLFFVHLHLKSSFKKHNRFLELIGPSFSLLLSVQSLFSTNSVSCRFRPFHFRFFQNPLITFEACHLSQKFQAIPRYFLPRTVM